MPEHDKLTTAARRCLGAAGRRALFRTDNGAATSLLERAAALLPPTEIDLALEHDLVDALFLTGRGSDALQRAHSLAERASAAGDRVGELGGRIKEAEVRVNFEPEGATEQLATLVAQAMPVFDAAADDLALFIGYSALGQVSQTHAQMDATLDAYEKAFAHAQRAGQVERPVGGRISARFFGTTPVLELLASLDQQEARWEGSYNVSRFRANALAMLGQFGEARTILVELRAGLTDRGGGIPLGAIMSQDCVLVELLASDPVAAVELGEKGCRLLDELGEKALLSTSAGSLAQALYEVDRLDEADVWARRSAELGASDDVSTQMLWRQVRAKVLARLGGGAEAERIAREAVAIGDETDMLNQQADAYADFAEVLSLCGRADEAGAAFEQAIERYERKGNVVSTARARARLAEIRAGAQTSPT